MFTLPTATTLPPFTPPPRFEATRFESYKPQHPSQEAALEKVQAFAAELSSVSTGVSAGTGFRWPWQHREVLGGRGVYLDGGFGVGKTHLLAAAYHASTAPEKVYVSFQELVYAVGVKGMKAAKEELGSVRLFCIDEFELDDPGNTLIIKTFLAHVFAQGGFVLTTSNTPPAAQGQGRFNAGDFKREIQSVAERFSVVSLDGPDYRKRTRLATLPTDDELRHRYLHEAAPEPKLALDWRELLELLGRYHPIRYHELLGRFGTLYLRGAETLPSQNDALRMVHFIDKAYDYGKSLRLSGVPLEALFDPSYRDGAYAKKHYRCLSRLSEMLEVTEPADG